MLSEERMEKLRDELQEALDSLDQDNILDIWNQRCEALRYDDDKIEYNNFIDEILDGLKPSEILDAVGRNYSTNDDYLYWDGYGYICSTNDVYDVADDSEIIDYIIDEWEDCRYTEIEDVLTEFETEYFDEDDDEE